MTAAHSVVTLTVNIRGHVKHQVEAALPGRVGGGSSSETPCGLGHA